MKANCGMGVLPHSALEFIVRGLAPAASILSASSICLARGEVKLARICILKFGGSLGCWDTMWETKGLDLSMFLRFFWCSRPLVKAFRPVWPWYSLDWPCEVQMLHLMM